MRISVFNNFLRHLLPVFITIFQFGFLFGFFWFLCVCVKDVFASACQWEVRIPDGK